MDEHDFLAERFEENRAHLRAVAYRMLGSLGASATPRDTCLILGARRRARTILRPPHRHTDAREFLVTFLPRSVDFAAGTAKLGRSLAACFACVHS